MKIGIEVDTRSFEQTLQGWEKEKLPFATAKALTQTAGIVKQAVIGQMEERFDRPTSWTLNSLFVKPATKSNLVASVNFKNSSQKATPPSIYMQVQIQGGQRTWKRSETQMQRAGVMPNGMFWVPGAGAKLNAYGNVQPSLLTQILSATGSFGEVGYLANKTRRSAKRNPRSLDVFVGRPGGGRLPLGVWQRMKNGTLKPLLIFVSKANYKSRLPFAQIATDVYESDFPALFDQALRDALILTPGLGGA